MPLDCSLSFGKRNSTVAESNSATAKSTPRSSAAILNKMEAIVLRWQRFCTLRKAREALRGRPCIYLQTDSREAILRVGESNDLWARYVGGTGYAVDAAMHGSGNLFFVASAPGDREARRKIEALLISRLQPTYNVQGAGLSLAPNLPLRHEGECPACLKASNDTRRKRTA